MIIWNVQVHLHKIIVRNLQTSPLGWYSQNKLPTFYDYLKCIGAFSQDYCKTFCEYYPWVGICKTSYTLFVIISDVQMDFHKSDHDILCEPFVPNAYVL